MSAAVSKLVAEAEVPVCDLQPREGAGRLVVEVEVVVVGGYSQGSRPDGYREVDAASLITVLFSSVEGKAEKAKALKAVPRPDCRGQSQRRLRESVGSQARKAFLPPDTSCFLDSTSNLQSTPTTRPRR